MAERDSFETMNPALKKRLIRTLTLSAIALFIGAGIGFVQVQGQNAQVISKGGQQSTVPGSNVGGPFTLTDHTGKTVTQADFTAPYKLIYFGFTYCPAICPTELQKITQALKALGPEAENVQPLFITIDPERDTVAVMKDYMTLFDKRFVGLTGSRQEVDTVLKDYRIYAKKVQDEHTNDYTMDHSSFIYLMNANDELIAIYRTEDTAVFIAQDIKAKLSPA